MPVISAKKGEDLNQVRGKAVKMILKFRLLRHSADHSCSNSFGGFAFTIKLKPNAFTWKLRPFMLDIGLPLQIFLVLFLQIYCMSQSDSQVSISFSAHATLTIKLPSDLCQQPQLSSSNNSTPMKILGSLQTHAISIFLSPYNAIYYSLYFFRR